MIMRKEAAVVVVAIAVFSAGPCYAETRSIPPPPPLVTQPIAKPIEKTVKKTIKHVTLDTSTINEPTKASNEPITKRRPLADSGLRYSSDDWLVSFLTTPTSFTLKRVFKRLLFNVAIAAAVGYFHGNPHDLSIPLTGHSLLASSLGLLLSYRTNSAYARFYEARGLWTKTKSYCRNLAILTVTFLMPIAPKASTELLELLLVFPSVLMHLCLGGGAKLSAEAQALLPDPSPPELYQVDYALPSMLMVKAMQHKIHDASEECKIASKHLLIAQHLHDASHMVEMLMDAATSCEKILRTPVPWTYTRHTSRFLTLWMGSLPFALVGNLSTPMTIAIIAAVSYCMFGIEEISHLIEQPFLGDRLEGDNEVWGVIDEDGEVATLIKLGRKTMPYDIGIPVCSLAQQIRDYVAFIANFDVSDSLMTKSSTGLSKPRF